ncbi:MAG: prepilin-type N-terminal cleavage/methylation domain-containing protein [Planctomycetes bacterium]|nr:prepilin-type N-terminal cleavage/methylation domain-containing protein [Planctomycetota bacterium]MBM4066127.1 prepilin-type N-terminal cleavage/methylation domain-containing protein [Planctomycetota bacterium]
MNFSMDIKGVFFFIVRFSKENLTKRRGFTLIEMIIVMVIVGIIAGISIPRYTGSLDTLKFRKAMSGIVFFLREARIEAMSTGIKTEVVLDLLDGYVWCEGKEKMEIPYEIQMFSDNLEDSGQEIRMFTFYPNGTANGKKLGFVFGEMTAVLNIEPLGGLAIFNLNEEMEQVVTFERTQGELSDEEIEKEIDALKTSAILSGRTGNASPARSASGAKDKDRNEIYSDYEDDYDDEDEDDSDDE